MKEKKVNLHTSRAAWRYGLPAIFLHWILAILITGMVCLGWYMMSAEHDPGSRWYFDLHKSFGLLVFALVLLRILWRFMHKPAKLPANLPKWQVVASSITQWLLYVCMFLLPITGFLGSSYSKSGVALFGLRLPGWFVPNHDMAEQFFSIHSVLVWVLVAAVALHAAAGLKHLIFDRNGVFQRMWF